MLQGDHPRRQLRPHLDVEVLGPQPLGPACQGDQTGLLSATERLQGVEVPLQHNRIRGIPALEEMRDGLQARQFSELEIKNMFNRLEKNESGNIGPKQYALMSIPV